MRKLWFALVLVCFGIPSVRGDDLPLMLEIRKDVETITAGRRFEIFYTLKNTGAEKYEYPTYTCSYFVFWKLDHSDMDFLTWKCRQDYPAEISLNQGETKIGRLVVKAREPVGPSRQITFRIGRTYGSRGTVWSNPLSIKVLEK